MAIEFKTHSQNNIVEQYPVNPSTKFVVHRKYI